MQITLDQAEAVRLFDIWHAELRTHPDNRTVEQGNVKLDTVPSERGAVHQMDGASVIVVYKTGAPATDRQVREAREATQVMRRPRRLYTGRLIDILKNAQGQVYFKIRTSDRRDEAHGNTPAFRAMNPSKGTLVKLVINPEMETLADLDPEGDNA